MDEIQKALVKAGRKDLAQRYYEKAIKTATRLSGKEIVFPSIGTTIHVDTTPGLTGNKGEFELGISMGSSSSGTLFHKGFAFPKGKDVPQEREAGYKFMNEFAAKMLKELKKPADKFESEINKILNKFKKLNR